LAFGQQAVSGISGEIMYVDGGFNTTAMGSLEE
jgi:enoyl-[acyl-carrier protein] reductase I